MRKVDVSTNNQPKNDRATTAMAICGSAICQTTAGIGRHCQNKRMSARLAKQNIGATFDRLRHIPRPPLLESPPRHDAVLHCKQRHQRKIDCYRCAQRIDHTAVDRLRNDKAADKPDRVEKRDQEYKISCKTEDECRGFTDRPLRTMFGRSFRLYGHGSPPPLALTRPGSRPIEVPMLCGSCFEPALIFL